MNLFWKSAPSDRVPEDAVARWWGYEYEPPPDAPIEQDEFAVRAIVDQRPDGSFWGIPLFPDMEDMDADTMDADAYKALNGLDFNSLDEAKKILETQLALEGHHSA